MSKSGTGEQEVIKITGHNPVENYLKLYRNTIHEYSKERQKAYVSFICIVLITL